MHPKITAAMKILLHFSVRKAYKYQLLILIISSEVLVLYIHSKCAVCILGKKAKINYLWVK